MDTLLTHSPDAKYRYYLSHIYPSIEEANMLGPVLWILLNPSPHDTATRLGATLSKCATISEREGYDGIRVVNLYAWISSDPKVLRHVMDPHGPENADALERRIAFAEDIIVGWGDNAQPRDVDFVHRLIRARADNPRRVGRVRCLGLTKAGQPRHPAHQATATPLIPYANHEGIWRPATSYAAVPRSTILKLVKG